MAIDDFYPCSSCGELYENFHYFKGRRYCENCIGEIEVLDEMVQKYEKPVSATYRKLFPPGRDDG